MRGQVSLEFSILFLALLIVVIVSTMTPGMYGYKKTVEVSSASLGHAALSKLKSNIERLSVADEGSKKEVLIKSPPGIWRINGTTITLEGNGFKISTDCGINLSTNNNNYATNMSGITVILTRNENDIYINWTD
jgi:uncharacterized protein (UPF0333 family)